MSSSNVKSQPVVFGLILGITITAIIGTLIFYSEKRIYADIHNEAYMQGYYDGWINARKTCDVCLNAAFLEDKNVTIKRDGLYFVNQSFYTSENLSNKTIIIVGGGAN